MRQGSTDSDLDVGHHNILESSVPSQTGRRRCPLCQSVFPLHHCLRHHHLSSEVHHPGWEEGKGRGREKGRKGGKKGESEEGRESKRGKEGQEGKERRPYV